MNLKMPSDEFFELCKFHVDLFSKHFISFSIYPKIKENLTKICLNETNKLNMFESWFSKKEKCFVHREYALNFLILLLIRKNSKWLFEKIIEKETQKKQKNKDKILIITN